MGSDAIVRNRPSSSNRADLRCADVCATRLLDGLCDLGNSGDLGDLDGVGGLGELGNAEGVGGSTVDSAIKASDSVISFFKTLQIVEERGKELV